MDDNIHPFGPGSHAPLADARDMPMCYPIKGNVDSQKYHRPDSQGYQQTKAEVWFDSPSAAEAAGFALAGSHPDGANPADFEPGGSQHPCDAAAVNANRSAAMGGGTPGSGSGQVTVDGDSTVGGSGISGGAVAGAAGVAGVAGAAAGMVGKGDGADMPDADVDAKFGGKATGAAAAGAAGVAGAAGLAASGGKDALGKVTGAAGDMGGKVTGAAAAGTAGVAGAAGLAATGGKDIGGKAAGAAGAGRDSVRAGAAGVGATAAGASIRSEVHDDDDDDGGGLAGCLSKWWWLLALIAAIIILGLILSQCNFGGDDEAAAPATTEAVAETTTTEAEVEETTTTEAPEATTTTQAPETTTTTTQAPEPEVLNLAGVAGETSPTVVGVLGPLGLNDVLSADGPFTVFLPSDAGAVAAIEAAPDLVMSVSDDPLLAQSILGFHVVPGVFTAADLADGAELVTSTGLTLTVADGAVNGIEISATDLEGSNGVIHVIEGILMPPAEPQLAVTGASSEVLGALGAVLVITGGAFVVTSSRRRNERDELL